MTTPITAYPLQWPEGWKRTAASQKDHGRFGKRQQVHASYSMLKDLTVFEATARVLEALTKMAVKRDDIVISTNLKTRLDGLPRSDQRAPQDSGAAAYWQEPTGERRCIAIDQYHKVEDNLAAIAATLDAMRAIERHGGAAILARAFTGFTALPAPGGAERTWWETLGVQKTATPEQIRSAWRTLANQAHPDKSTGSHEAMAAINAAREKGLTAC